MDEIENFDELIKDPEALKAKIKEVVTANVEKATTSATKKVDDFEEYKTAIQKIADLEKAANDKLKETNPAEASKKELEDLRKSYEDIVKGLNDQITGFKDKETSYQKEKNQNKLKEEFNKTFKTDKYKMLEDFSDDQLYIFLSKFDVNEKGEIVEKSGKLNSQAKPFGLEDYAAELLTSKPKLFNPVKFGTGTQPNQHTKAPVSGNKISIFEANKLLKTNPEKYFEYEKQGLIDF